MFCPKCRAEFRDGFTTCAECRVELVDELKELSEEEIRLNEEDNYYKDSENVLIAEDGSLLCPECHAEYRDDIKVCNECGVELVKEVWLNSLGEQVDTSVASIDLDSHEYHTDLSETEHVILIESDDVDIIHPMLDILNDNKVPFEFQPADTHEETLGGIMATTVTAEPKLHSILVRLEDETKAFELMQEALNSTVELPEELYESEDEEEV